MRLGTVEDPGFDPDPNKHYWRFGTSYHIEKFDRRWAVYDQPDPSLVRPFGFVNVAKELYQQNEKYVWVWMADPVPQEEGSQPATVPAAPSMNPVQLEYFKRMRPEYAPLTVPESDVTVRFEEASTGLPTGGSWRNSLAVADMNEDGCPDLIAPPERGAGTQPAIFLGDCKGNWKYWSSMKFPYGIAYGSVAAADFNKDGHMDLAFGVHLNGVHVFLGDGKGNFVAADNGLKSDFPTRRIVVADVDHDGYPDIVALSEGPASIRTDEPRDYGKLRVYYNRNKGTVWEGINVSSPNEFFGGDWLSVGNFNGDAYPDFVAASVYYNGPDILWVSDGKMKWKNIGGGTTVPWLSYHFASTAGHFTSQKLDDAIVSFVRVWPSDLVDPKIFPDPPEKNVVGIDRISFTGKEPKRVPIVRWAGTSGVFGMASGDFDGDGKLDIVYTIVQPRAIEILLGDGKGGFRRAKVQGLQVEPNSNYDIKVADLNGDGRPDIILMYESKATSALGVRDGSIKVFLNRGTVVAAAPEKK